MSKISLSSAIREGLHEEMQRDENVICIGEDIGVMNGTFAVTKGFLDEFGAKRVWDTPISESGFTGIAVGAALTQQMHHTGKIVVCFFGDGATNEGVFHEAVNMASIWNLPVIFYCINNGYGISADIKKMTNIEHIHERSAAYGVPGMFIEDGNNVLDVYEGFQKAVEHVRSGKGPVLIESVTYRWLGHSSSDPGKYRTREEVEEWKKKDPIENLRKYLLANQIASDEELEAIQAEVKEAVEASVKFAEESPFPPLESAFEDIYAD